MDAPQIQPLLTILKELRSTDLTPYVYQNLEDLLTSSIKETQTNASFRQILGKEKDFWDGIGRLYDLSYEQIPMELPFVNALQLSLLKLTRNLFANVTSNQDKALEHGINKRVERIVSYYITHNPTENAECFVKHADGESDSTAGSLDRFHKPGDISLVTCNDDLTLSAALVLILNCIHGSRERRLFCVLCDYCQLPYNTAELTVSSFHSESLYKTESGRRLFSGVLQQTELLLENEESKSFELIYTITGRLIELGLFIALFESLKSSNGATFTSTQTTLLKILDSKIHVSSSSSSFIPLSHQLPSSTIHGLARIFNDASSRAVHLMRQLPPATPSTSREPDEPILSSVEDTANLYTGLVLLLQCFGYLSLEEAEAEARSRAALSYSSNSCFLALLAQADITIPRITKSVMALSSATSFYVTDADTTHGSVGFKYVKRDVVRVLGNLAAGNRSVQDEVSTVSGSAGVIRRLGGIPTILNQCNIDDANPYLREYAILALRNILAGNPENQALIAELTPVGAAQNPVLGEIGLQAEVGENGKVRVRPVEKREEVMGREPGPA
ncbi:spinocerebellar ataxia type 10 protein domain-containing protein [Endogone sp. FLAS-F59071]|nr:spinocerebellar ataxia type 10 protein domain-containing protein [Endogone sp. FLAS-F59071]|eukprot:RUS22844.1 spinocerebellar ataxia type 10 protein domain-containing protein [Endogone sp. FLAS-F59071]